MCLCGPPSPVFMRPANIASPLLDDWIGWRWGRGIRALFPRQDPQASADALLAPHGVRAKAEAFICGCDSSYLSSAFSSAWALLACLLAIGAGLAFASKRMRALFLLGAGFVFSATDTGLRLFHRLDLPPEYRETMFANLPIQILANALFQFALPFAAGWVIVRIIRGRKAAPDAKAEMAD